MMILRRIGFAICIAVYPLIPGAYNIFRILSEHEFFDYEVINSLSSNLYIFISVCMLFAFGIRLLNGIINPDLLDEKKKGIKSLFFHAFVAVLLIAIIPFGFRMLYSIQKKAMESHFIEKILLGTQIESSQDPGLILASYTFSAFCVPSNSATDGTTRIYNWNANTMSTLTMTALSAYANTRGGIADIVPEYNDVYQQISEFIDENSVRPYDLDFNAIICPIAGIVILYELIVLCIDLALRSVKLSLLELMAPVILCGYIFKGPDLLQKWFKEVISTWVLLFLKMVAIIFMLYGLSMLSGFLDEVAPNENFITKGLLKLFILIGLLQLIKQIPTIINSIFGTNIQSRGGIKGRLGEMAVVGKMAQEAWSHPLQTARKVASAPIAAVGGVASHLAAASDRVNNLRQRAREQAALGTNEGREAAHRLNRDAVLTGLGGFLTSGLAGIRAGSQGFREGNLQALGDQGRRYRETHPEGSTFTGTIEERVRSGLGLRSRVEIEDRNNNDVVYNGQRMSVDQLKNLRSSREVIINNRNAIREAAVGAVTDERSNYNLTGRASENRRNDIHNRLQQAIANGDADLQRTLTAIENAYNTLDTYAGTYRDAMGNTYVREVNYTRLKEQLDSLTVPLQQGINESDDDFRRRNENQARIIDEYKNALKIVLDDSRDHIVEVSTSTDLDHLQDVLSNRLHLQARDIGIINTNVATAHGIQEFTNYEEFNNNYVQAQNEHNAMGTVLDVHQQEVYQIQNSQRHREMEANRQAAEATRNNNRNSNNNSN